MTDNPDKQRALAQIEALARERGLSAREVIEHLSRRAEADCGESIGLPARITAYLGAIFILAGVFGAIELLWPTLGPIARVLMTYGSGMVALILALIAMHESRLQFAATPLFLIGALLQAAGLFVFLQQTWRFHPYELGAVLVFSVLTAQNAILMTRYRRTSLLFLCLLFASLAIAVSLDMLEVDGGFAAFLIGVSGMLVTWKINTTAFRPITPLAWTGYGFCVAGGAFEMLQSWFPFDFALIGLAAILIHLGVLARSRALLVTAVISMLGFLGYFTGEYFAELLSWPIALVILGIAMLAISAWAVRLGSRISP